MSYLYAADLSSLAEDDAHPVDLQGLQLALYLVEGRVYATSNICTHQKVLLSDGFMEDGCIECPLHAGRFDVRTGAALCEPATQPLKVFPVRIEDNRVMVDVG
ncbi:MAG TPA: non-heme iron oxygenase ferredoxin subunit [Bordetella sp.]